ncbi:MAG: hypothetical protein ACRDY1_01225 [Acidimicrobiales bacterium]
MDDGQNPDPTGRLLGDFVRHVSARVVTPPMPATEPDPGRRRRRRTGRARITFTVAGAAAVLAAVVGLLVADGPRSADTGPAVTGRPAHPAEPSRPGPVTVRSLTLRGAFQPDQVVGGGGAVWLVGSDDGTDDAGGCRIARVDPATMAMTASYPLSACGINAVAGAGKLFLETEQATPGTNDTSIHIEAVSPATDASTVFAPVDMTVVGSEIAHTQLAYADGWLWLDGYVGGQRVVQISPTTGGVEKVFSTGVPEAGGVEPVVVGGAGEVWLAGGSGGSPTGAVIWAAPTALEPTLVPLPPFTKGPGSAPVTVWWMAPVAGRMWVGLVTETAEAGAPGGRLTERIAVLDVHGTVRLGRSGRESDAGGTVVARSGPVSYGGAPVVASGQVFSVGPGTSCRSQPVWRIDPATQRTTEVARLHPPFDPCLAGESYRSVTVAGGDVFVLDTEGGPGSGVLYRIRP